MRKPFKPHHPFFIAQLQPGCRIYLIEVVKLYREDYLQAQEDERGEGGQLEQHGCQYAIHIL